MDRSRRCAIRPVAGAVLALALAAAPPGAAEEPDAELQQAERIDRAMGVLDDPLPRHLVTEMPAPPDLPGEQPFLQEPPRAQEDFSEPPPQQQGP